MRVTLDLMEASALLHAADLALSSHLIGMKKARKLNDLAQVAAHGMAIGDLTLAANKLREELASSVQTPQPSPPPALPAS